MPLRRICDRRTGKRRQFGVLAWRRGVKMKFYMICKVVPAVHPAKCRIMASIHAPRAAAEIICADAMNN